MSRETYFRIATFAPLVLPVPAVALMLLAPNVAAFSLIGFVLGGSIAYAGVPYLLFAFGVLAWSRGRDANRLRSAALRAPLIFAPFGGLGVATIAFIEVPRFSGWLARGLLGGMIVTIIVGYMYVALVLVFERLLFRIGASTDASVKRAP